MKKNVSIKAKASKELLLAWKDGTINDLLKSKNLPTKKFAYGDSAICIEFKNDDVKYFGNRKIRTCFGDIIININTDLLTLENLDFPIYHGNYQEKLNQEDQSEWNKYLSQRLASQENPLKPDILTICIERLGTIADIEYVSDKNLRFVPFGENTEEYANQNTQFLIYI